MKLSDLRVNPDNPRLIKDAKFKKLCNSVRDFPKMMELRPIVIDKVNGNLILGGNMRYLALKTLKFTEIPDEWVKDAAELTEDEKRRFIIEDNMPFGEWDFDLLANSFDTSDLIEWGFDEKELGVSKSTEQVEEEQTDGAFHCKACGLGVYACKLIFDDDENFRKWKDNVEANDFQTEMMAKDLEFLIKRWNPILPNMVLTTPPRGSSNGPYPAGFLAKKISSFTGLDYQELLERSDKKIHHGKFASMEQKPFLLKKQIPEMIVLVIDDFTNSGTTMKLSLECLRNNNIMSFGFIWGRHK